jgi:uncharacterized protein (TIGR02266 family)
MRLTERSMETRTMQTGRERRILPRWHLRAGVTLESDDNLYAGISCDVSAGGIFVASNDSPPVGEAVTVTVTMPDATVLQLEGTVRWAREHEQSSPGLPAGCGIEWHDLPATALRSLLHFAELRDPLLYEL